MPRPIRTWALALATPATLAGALALVVSGSPPSTAAPNEAKPAPVAQTSPHRSFLSKAESESAAAAGLLPGSTRSILKIPGRMKYGDFTWNDRGVPPGKIAVRIDVRLQLISVFRAGHEIGSAVILYGAPGYDTPLGSYPILAKARDHTSSIYDAPMPFTLRLTNDGVSIHGSDVRRGAATHGCIGIPLEFAANLFQSTRIGDRVQIVRSRVPRST